MIRNCLPIAPGSPPINFTAIEIGPFSALFSWSPPANPNGEIISYTLTYNLSGLSMTAVANTTQDRYLVTGLDAYTIYEVTMFASTIAGSGPATASIVLRTDMSSKYKINAAYILEI